MALGRDGKPAPDPRLRPDYREVQLELTLRPPRKKDPKRITKR